MEKKELNITISGEAGSGKSKLTYLLKKFLIENGFEVEHQVGIDFSNEEEFNKTMMKKHINNFVETRKIKIKEQQLNKSLI